MSAYAALASLLNNIDQIMNHPRLSTSLDNNQIQSLQEKAGFLLHFIEGNYNGGVVSKEAEDLERQIARAANAAEDLIESHIVDQILAASADDGETSSSFLLNVQKKIRDMKKKVQNLKRRMACAAHAAEDEIESHTMDQSRAGSNQPSLTCSLHLQHIIQDIDAILKKANELKEKEELIEEQPQSHPRPLLEIGETTAMVGFDDELIQLLDVLTNQRSSRHIISIVGMGGTGKTTLAQNLYQNSLIKQHFDIRAWATISQQYSVKEILSHLLPAQGESSARTVDELGLQLHKALSGRRYLIVLDDIWSVEAWDKVRHFFPDNGNRSRVVLTTRLSKMAIDCCSSSCFMMKPLDEHENWTLFCKKAFQQENCPDPQLESIGKEISRLCRGLPLSTVVIGGLLLKSPRSVQFWYNFVKNITSNPDAKEKQESLDILSLSYNHLPPHLKPCFLYMGVFEEDSEIRVSKVIQLWVAEGFLRPNNTQILEEVGEGYLNELIDRNLISVRKHRKNGKIGSCGIHDLLRDMCLKIGQQQEFFHVIKGEIRGTERRLIRGGYWPLLAHIGAPLVRSMLVWTPLEFVVNCKLLRVCDEGYLRSSSEIWGNVNLRYLGCQDLFEHEVPSSVSLIWNLQTLIIKDFEVNAPVEIWKMRQLRHVKCDSIYLPDPPWSDGLVTMDELRTLKGAENLRVCEELCKIIPNIKKLHLLYGSQWQGYDESLIECVRNLDGLHKLESLNLSFSSREFRYQELYKKATFPISLRKLSLRGCQLGSEDLSVIGWLPALEVLQLQISSNIKEWSPIYGQFARLKFLEIGWLSLDCWNADNSHFPVLEKLVLGDVAFEIPLGIGDIPTLELIRVNYYNESAMISALKVKKDQLEYEGNDALQIQVRVSASEVEGFKERVEEEGLTINDIQLEIWGS